LTDIENDDDGAIRDGDEGWRANLRKKLAAWREVGVVFVSFPLPDLDGGGAGVGAVKVASLSLPLAMLPFPSLCCARNYVALRRGRAVDGRGGWVARSPAEGERNILRLG